MNLGGIKNLPNVQQKKETKIQKKVLKFLGEMVGRSNVITCGVCWETLGAVGPAAWAELVLSHLVDEISSTFLEPAPQSRPHKGERRVYQNFQSCPANC